MSDLPVLVTGHADLDEPVEAAEDLVQFFFVDMRRKVANVQ